MKPADLEACMKVWKHREFMDKTSELQGMAPREIEADSIADDQDTDRAHGKGSLCHVRKDNRRD